MHVFSLWIPSCAVLPQGGSQELSSRTPLLLIATFLPLSLKHLLPFSLVKQQEKYWSTKYILRLCSHRVVVLSSAEHHTAGGDLLLRGAGRRKVLTTTQRCCKTVRWDWGHSVGNWYTALLQLRRNHNIFDKINTNVLLCSCLLDRITHVVPLSKTNFQFNV